MFSKIKLSAAVLLAATIGSASAMELKVNAYTSNSITFTLTGTMPSTDPGTLLDGPNEIDLLYSGNLWSGGQTYGLNALTGSPIVGAGQLVDGKTGGFPVPTNYSWMYFQNHLTGLAGSGQQVTLTFASGTKLLNTSGTGTIDLYWSNLSRGPDANGAQNVLLSSVNVVNGVIGGSNAVPEPGSVALLGLGILGLAAARRRAATRS